ncbi:Hypothetical protein SMAX5B_015966 [Scophthalmus maximus]|uniref:Uncharacterized protein n=1 Tax=Scophthalmus maximus TaxID=52904 RepID=A0A2U9CSA0_SCOMX|nr:Hypothetical protein SMAX5B_015966 [Scophthalmus maximus]
MSWRTIHLHYVRNQRHNVEKFLWRTVKLERRHSTESVHSPTLFVNSVGVERKPVVLTNDGPTIVSRRLVLIY